MLLLDTSPPPPGSPAHDAMDPGVPLVAFCHLRWDFVRQRPQHILSRFAREREVFAWEEPIVCDHPLPYLEYHRFPTDRVTSLRPRLPHWWSAAETRDGLAELYRTFAAQTLRGPAIKWYYTPAMRAFSSAGEAALTVYDCMDELSAFDHADPALVEQERGLVGECDVVFTGGHSLYAAKAALHPNVHAVPSGVDVAHFLPARALAPAAGTPFTLGYYGVIDERIDLVLIAAIAAARPEWLIEMVGPVVKIDPAALPQAPNIRWAGQRAYSDLPATLGAWHVAIMPFAINDATRFISPTKTPEYLAGGRPVVSTPITDVVRSYGEVAGVTIAADAAGFVMAVERAAALPPGGDWLAAADAVLAHAGWDAAYGRMTGQLADAAQLRTRLASGPRPNVTVLPPPAPNHGAGHSSGPRERFDYLVVGAGFAGAVMAERLAADAGKRVLVIDRRPHIAGNAFDEADAAGVLIHRYGPHIFHTNSDEVFAYLSRFTRWRPYEHRVLADLGDRQLPMPINRSTLEGLYGIDLPDDASAAAFLAARAEPRDPIRTSEDVVVNAVGHDLYRRFFRGYTRKQWGLDPAELDRTVTSRVPTRTSRDDRYFEDRHQAMPADGYTAMFERILEHPGITVRLGIDFADLDVKAMADHVVFTGPIDEYFGYRFGKLPYRSLEFVHETVLREEFQAAAVVNYPDEATPYTRITEYKKLTGQVHPATSISYEYPRAEGDPFYPIPRPANQALYKQYEELALREEDVTFVGRLANYRYYNMDQVVGQALATYRRLRERGAAAEGAATPARIAT